MSAPATPSLLEQPEALPLRLPDSVGALGRVVVLAPHPDDESLGCGGLLSLSQQSGQTPHVVLMTDGTRSHPHSRSHPPSALARLREEEARRAVEALGLTGEQITFARWPDCGIPRPYEAGFEAATDRLRDLLASLNPDTVLVPWRGDPHRDHEATWLLARAACLMLPHAPLWIEYPVWAWAHPASEHAPRSHQADAWRLDVSDALPRKRRAIAAHVSQTTDLISDDPQGFRLSNDFLACFDVGFEVYLAPHDAPC